MSLANDKAIKQNEIAQDEIPQNEIERQNYYIDQIKQINDHDFSRTGKEKQFYISTLGCQMNAHDSDKLQGILSKMGFVKTEEEKSADVVLYNTCCVRENAENKVYGNLGFLKNIKAKNKNMKIVLCGCMMQQDTVVEKIKKTYRHVDVIFGTYNLYRFPQLLYTSFETNEMIIDVWKEHHDVEDDLPYQRTSKYKSSVNIMYGCNNFCSYCIVPYVRGRERSRGKAEILKEVEQLAKDGVKEITLLGQNVNSYGTGSEDEVSFPELLRAINKIEGIERIRFMTSHPKDLSRELIDAIRDLDKVCKHLHLPFQSGSTNILNKMNRKYTKEEYLNLIKEIKTEIPDMVLTTDIIVGFPGESEEDFNDTIDVVEKVKFSGAFTFLYSKRTGTKAANMEEQIPEPIAKERFQRLVNVLNPISLAIMEGQVGKTLKVLVEEVNKKDSALLSGRTDTNLIVHFKATEELLGEIINIKIMDCKTFYLFGEIIN